MQIAGILLKLSDGSLILHRRDQDTDVSSGLLGFFGGEIEKNEDPYHAVKRELEEETSLKSDSMDINFLTLFDIPEPSKTSRAPKRFHLFEATIPHADFEVFEGVGKEIYTLEQALKREDLTASVKYFLEISGDNHGA